MKTTMIAYEDKKQYITRAKVCLFSQKKLPKQQYF